ncbi:uncharacterized protein LOC115333004 [Ixodes scapularis]|uniref:uncharacterized protein LOC115333004 n=1 Tax=Ixodes scapularis TaxID=6945 RepID=UPI001A9FD8FF|nr:uncharacterized protein LOC115333004 [Ixodes scapularis]
MLRSETWRQVRFFKLNIRSICDAFLSPTRAKLMYNYFIDIAESQDNVSKTLEKGPKYAVEPKAKTVDLIGMVHDVARKVSEEEKNACIAAGIRAVSNKLKTARQPGVNTNHTCTSSQTREFLEVRQREAGRMALGAHRGTPNEGVQGDLGWSAFESREAVAKLSYERRLCGLGEERWARRVFKYLVYRSLNTRLTKRVARLAGKYEVPPTLLDGRPLREGVADLKKHVRQVETRRWTESATRKPSMTVYAASKRAIEREQLYDDSRGSGLLFEARTGTLKTRLWRSRHDAGAPIACVACGAAEETTEHLVLQCKALSPCPQVDHLPDALGFRTAERGDDGEEHVETTKRRLEQWWEISWRLWKRERRAGPDVQAQAGQPMFSAQVDLPHTEDPTEAVPQQELG